MTKKELLAMSNAELDRVVKIQGTKFDRKRQLSDSDILEIRRLSKCGKTIAEIARLFGVSWTAVKYQLMSDDERVIHNTLRSGKHYTAANEITQAQRVEYKKMLIKSGAKVIYPMN